MTGKTLAVFMAEVREYVFKEPGESDEEYKQRLYELAHIPFEKYMAEMHANLMLLRHGEKADTRDRLTREREQERKVKREIELDAQYRALERPVQTVHQELLHSKQTKLRKAKARYQR